MAIQLKAIKFNHSPGTATSDALNIRKNRAQVVNVPEWVAGNSVNFEDSPAAYSLKDTRGKVITIEASFKWVGLPTRLMSTQVRTIPSTMKITEDIPYDRITGEWPPRSWPRPVPELPVLGLVKQTPVNFKYPGESGFVKCELFLPLLKASVGVYNLKWKWQYRTATGTWKDIGITNHRIYVLLSTPNAPWTQQPYDGTNDQLPWTEVLDFACRWAKGATNADSAAGKVTEAINALGPGRITYDCPGGGDNHYSYPNFNCSEFLERVNGGTGLGQYVNCSDCATFVSTFSNILGCNLWQSKMGWNFSLNAGISIGSDVWQTACNWGGFSYHEVAWKGACDENEGVFDACLKVDGDDDPHSEPRTPVLPKNMKFGTCAEHEYRFRLTTPAGCPSCQPQPSTRTRRAVV